MDEIDYRHEGANLKMLGEQLSEKRADRGAPPSGRSHVLARLDDGAHQRKSVASMGPPARMELDSPALGEDLVGAYLKKVLIYGFLHPDPHPGNVVLAGQPRIPPGSARAQQGRVKAVPASRQHLTVLTHNPIGCPGLPWRAVSQRPRRSSTRRPRPDAGRSGRWRALRVPGR